MQNKHLARPGDEYSTAEFRATTGSEPSLCDKKKMTAASGPWLK